MRPLLLILVGLGISGCQTSPQSEPQVAAPAEPQRTSSAEEQVAAYNAKAAAQQDEPASQQAVTVEEEKVICRREVITGSHFHRTICRTIKEIRDDQDDAFETLRRMSEQQSAGAGAN